MTYQKVYLQVSFSARSFLLRKYQKLKSQKKKKIVKYIIVHGQLFFASVSEFVEAFDYTSKNKKIEIDFSDSHIWDESAVGAIDKVVLKLKEQNNQVTMTNLNASGEKLVHTLAVSYLTHK